MAAPSPERAPMVEVARGIWQLKLPFDDNPLGYSFAYVVRTSGGALLVDAGAPSDHVASVFHECLALIGMDVNSIVGILLTHAHFDHFGLAQGIADASGAWVAVHPADDPLFRGRRRDLARAELAWLDANGIPADAVEEMSVELLALPSPGFTGAARPLNHGDIVRLGDHELEVAHTPGHSPGHVCLLLRSHGVVFTGDHILPRITPLVGLWSDVPKSPLGEYLDAVELIGREGAATALPGHEWAFSDVRARTVALREHHEERLKEVSAHVEDGAPSLWELAQNLHWSRPWGELEPMSRYCAIGEVASHVRELAARGTISRSQERRLLISRGLA